MKTLEGIWQVGKVRVWLESQENILGLGKYENISRAC